MLRASRLAFDVVAIANANRVARSLCWDKYWNVFSEVLLASAYPEMLAAVLRRDIASTAFFLFVKQ